MSRAYPWWMGPAALLGAWMLRALGNTWRIERVEMERLDQRMRSGERCILALWHSRLLPLTFTHRGRGVGVLISRHRDGELIARIVRHLGYATARGSSTRGGEEGLREMLRLAEGGRVLTLTPDGPRGPAEQVKPGLVYLASRTGFPVVPVSSSASSVWRLRTWDGFRIPRPFARVVVGYGPAIQVPPGIGEREMEEWRLRLERALRAHARDLDRRLGVPA